MATEPEGRTRKADAGFQPYVRGWLRRLDPQKTQSHLAKYLGMSPAQLSRILSGESGMFADDLTRIAEFIERPQAEVLAAALGRPNVPAHPGDWPPEVVDDLVGRAAEVVLAQLSEREQNYRILARPRRVNGHYPLYRYLAAGNPDAAEDLPEIVDDIEPPSSDIAERIGEDGYAVLVDGASMEGEGIHDGDVVWVRRCRNGEYQPTDIVAALVKTEADAWRLVVKRYDQAGGVKGLFSVPAPHRKEPTNWHEYRVIGRVVAWHPQFEIKRPRR